MSETKTCINCAHRIDEFEPFGKCARTGTYCTLEMQYGGRCAGPRDGVPEMNLWEQRPQHRTLWMRITGRAS